MMSNDLTTLSADLKDFLLNEEIIALDQDILANSAQAFTLGDVQISSTVQLWVKLLHNGDVAAAVVDLGTFDGEVFNATVSAAQLGFHASDQLQLRDVVQRKDAGSVQGSFSVLLRPYDVVVYRVHKV